MTPRYWRKGTSSRFRDQRIAVQKLLILGRAICRKLAPEDEALAARRARFFGRWLADLVGVVVLVSSAYKLTCRSERQAIKTCGPL